MAVRSEATGISVGVLVLAVALGLLMDDVWVRLAVGVGGRCGVERMRERLIDGVVHSCGAGINNCR